MGVRVVPRNADWMTRFVGAAESLVVRALVLLLLTTVCLGTVSLGRVVFQDIVAPPLLLDLHELFDSFELFVVILIGIELLRSMMILWKEDRAADRQNSTPLMPDQITSNGTVIRTTGMNGTNIESESASTSLMPTGRNRMA